MKRAELWQEIEIHFENKKIILRGLGNTPINCYHNFVDGIETNC